MLFPSDKNNVLPENTFSSGFGYNGRHENKIYFGATSENSPLFQSSRCFLEVSFADCISCDICAFPRRSVLVETQKCPLVSRLWGLTEKVSEQAWYIEFWKFSFSSLHLWHYLPRLSYKILRVHPWILQCLARCLSQGCSANVCDTSEICIKGRGVWMKWLLSSIRGVL